MQGRIKKIREYFGLSQAQFAQKIHISPGLISNIETMRNEISERTLNSICEAFPINLEWLRNGTGEMLVQVSEQNPINKEGISKRVKEVRTWMGLTQKAFAERIKYSAIQVHSVENGKVIPSNQFLEKISKEFGVSYEWLSTGTGLMENVDGYVDDKLIKWLEENPEVVRELRIRGGLD